MVDLDVYIKGSAGLIKAGRGVNLSIPVVSQGRGPDGTHWPTDTPAYDTPATTFISTLDDLVDAVNAASSGDVIELAAHTWNPVADEVEFDAGNTGWAQNVLVRPPLGQRGEVVLQKQARWRMRHVTLAGFTYENSFRMWVPNRLWIARSVLATNQQCGIDGAVNSGWYEVVKPEYYIADRDVVQIKNAFEFPCQNVYLVGCNIKGNFNEDPLVGTPHSDTVQALSNPVHVGLHLIDNIFHASADKTMQFHGDELTDFNIINTWINCPNSSEETLPPGAGWREMPDGSTAAIAGVADDISIQDSEIYGYINSDFLEPRGTVSDSTVWGGTAFDNGAITVGANVTVSPGSYASPPAMPNLDSIWGT